MAARTGWSTETLGNWVPRVERDAGVRSGLASGEREQLKALERENRDFRRTN